LYDPFFEKDVGRTTTRFLPDRIDANQARALTILHEYAHSVWRTFHAGPLGGMTQMNLTGKSSMIVSATTDSRFREEFREELQIDNEPISFCVRITIVNAISRGGATKRVLWENMPTIRSSAFQGADFVWLVTTREGALMFTSDGGKTWNKIQGNAVGGKFDAVALIDQKHGWAANSEGRVWKSDDGGKSWIAISTLTQARAMTGIITQQFTLSLLTTDMRGS
jgi:hypothetical protein